MKQCLKAQVVIRKVQRHPVSRRIQRYVKKGVTFGVIPTSLNDIVFHHAPLTTDEVMHVIIDQVSTSSMVAIALLAARSLSD
jgi:hypothetical protein